MTASAGAGGIHTVDSTSMSTGFTESFGLRTFGVCGFRAFRALGFRVWGVQCLFLTTRRLVILSTLCLCPVLEASEGRMKVRGV